MLTSIIIPCYNEQEVLAETYKRLTAVMQGIDGSYELIFINDGSRDATLDILRSLADRDKSVRVLNFSRNFGHQCAVSAGLKFCNGDFTIIIDADLQDPPEVIVEMLKIQKAENANVVYGVRKHRKGENKFKLLTAKWFYRFLNRMSEVPFPVDTGDFRLMDRQVVNQFNKLEERNKYIRGLISWMGFKQVPCYYEREARFAGETKYPLRKMIKFALIGLFYFSKKPLNIATSLGFASIALGFLYLLWILISVLFIHGHTITGWASTVALIVFFGGVQLLTIGVLGKYIGNLFDEVKGRPEYIVSEQINFDK